MKRKLWVVGSVVVGLLLVVAGGGLALKKGLLVRASGPRLSELVEVPEFDILAWQFSREEEILANFQADAHGLENPFVLLDPYEMNPLAALVLFDTQAPCSVEVRVEGKDAVSEISYTLPEQALHHEVPVLGLYPGKENRVFLTAHFSDGASQTTSLSIATDPLPVDFQVYSLVESQPEKMEPGLTLMIACFSHSYTCLLDANGDVRGYLSRTDMAHGTSIVLLQNGRFLSTGDEYRQIPYNMTSLWEWNWLGKVFKEYEVPNGVHHDVNELPNGDFLAVSNHRNMFQSGTREDVVVVVDRSTGRVETEMDFRDILVETREPYHHFHPDILNTLNIDWMHTNGAILDPQDGTYIVSSPTQSMVVKVDPGTSRIVWILGPHEGYEAESAKLEPWLLSPVGEEFEWAWCQHEPMIMPDADGNPGTLDLLLFDNGQSRSFWKEGAVLPEHNYSRAVVFRIDEKNRTVEQLWEYGKERGSELYSTFLGDADYLPCTSNRLIAFGGQLRSEGKPVDEIFSGVMGTTVTRSRVVEVTEKGEVVFEVAVQENAFSSSAETYQVERIPVFSAGSFGYSLGEVRGERVGESKFLSPATSISAPLLFRNKLGVCFHDMHREGDKLVVDGAISYEGKTYLLGRAFLVFRSEKNVYVFEANTSLNGRFFASVNLSDFEPGEYMISIAGAVREGNDALNGEMKKGHVLSGYRVTLGSGE
ncbi:MAG TPA: aryl-sulfate sulfotransferase [Thermotogota bacterium]|nr:aryl-sulfate sulfotransferase [Thermotogota bacterium]